MPVDWNLAVTPDPFAQVAAGRDYAKKIFDQSATSQAGAQYAAGDLSGAANTIARRGDFENAGKLSALGTARTAGAQYVGGDPAGAVKTFASAGNFDEAGKLQTQQVNQFQAQHNALRRAVPYLKAAKAQGKDPVAAYDAIAAKFKALGVPDADLAKIRDGLATDPDNTMAALEAMGNIDPEFKEFGGVGYVFDKNGDPTKPIATLGGDALFGNATEGRALNIVNKGPGTPGYDLAKAYLERQTGQVAQTPSGPLFIQGPRFTVPGQPGQGNQPAPPPPPGGGSPAPGTATRVGDRTVTPLPTGSRPVPPAVGTAEDEDIKAILTTSNVDKDMKAFQDMLASGQLVLGPGANAASALRNWSGWSNEASRNYGDFRAAIEQMRNATLLLQKGMQTEGDARRALNEIADNMNDNAYVNQRLERIRGYNARAAQERSLNINIRRQRSKSDPFDWTQLQIPDSPYAAPPPGATPRAKAPPVRLDKNNADAEYNALPSGQEFIAPDGSHRTKP